MGSGKEFLLRDEEDKLQCVFYEIVSYNIRKQQ